MSNIKIIFRDGSKREFAQEVRTGGSYRNQVLYEGPMVIVRDVWGTETAFPVELVSEVIAEPEPGRW